MARRATTSPWTRAYARGLKAYTRAAVAVGERALRQAMKQPVATRRKAAAAATAAPAPAANDLLSGIAVGPAGARRYRLYRPPGIAIGSRLPLLVMLHGCGQDAAGFAAATRMNRIAAREGFLVLYPEQDRLANAQGCWNWYDTRSGRAQGEAALLMAAIDQVCMLYPADRQRVAVAGLSAGAGMAALLATRYPDRFRAVVMHSGVAPGTADSTLTALRAMQGRRAMLAPVATAARAVAAGAAVTVGTVGTALAAAPQARPPLLVIHGGRDGIVAPSNGEAAALTWAAAAGAHATSARTVARGKRYPMTVTDYKRGGRALVTLVEVGALGHAWSGGTARAPFSDPMGPDASRMVWAFVWRQLRQKPQPRQKTPQRQTLV